MNDIEKLNSEIEELKEKMSELSEKIEELQDNIEGDIEDAVDNAVEDTIYNYGEGGRRSMYILSQDKKILSSFVCVEAYRLKKNEEPYAITARVSNSIGHVIGRYENKEAALAEIKRISQALAEGRTFYEVQ